jgi:hypothetical protein
VSSAGIVRQTDELPATHIIGWQIDNGLAAAQRAFAAATPGSGARRYETMTA